MKFHTASDVAELLAPDALRAELATALGRASEVPARTIYKLQPRLFFGMMPAWQQDDAICVKLVTLALDNPGQGLPSIRGLVVLFDGRTGTPLAAMDGAEITRRRTAAASALAADLLARRDASTYALLGAGALALPMIEAMASTRAIKRVQLWARSIDKARALAAAARAKLPAHEVTVHLRAEEAVAGACIVSTITASPTPVLQGAWLAPGVHVDLVGNHHATQREADDAVILRGRVFVDFRESAFVEAGEILIPLRAGLIAEQHVLGELRDLVDRGAAGRLRDDDITVFKSVGNGLEDLVAARLVHARAAATHTS